LTGLARSPVGHVGLRLGIVICVAAVLAASWRVADAMGVGDRNVAARPTVQIAPDYPRLNHPGPALRLVDQRGQVVTLEQFRGRPVIVTFAYGHCETVCPVVVEEVLRARERLGQSAPAVVVVTLDPWRDTPARLPALVTRWNLPGESTVLSGTVAEVEAALDRWNVGRSRDPRTGEITHPNLVYIVDANGRIAYSTVGDAGAIEELVKRLG
jgi:protein SCO1